MSLIDFEKDGHRILLQTVPFAHSPHRYRDRRHAVNFVRYLFSTSVAHPVTSATTLNSFIEFGRGDETLFNENPEGFTKRFLETHLSGKDDHAGLYDDGFYALFMVRDRSGRFSSNVMSGRSGGPVSYDPLVMAGFGAASIAAFSMAAASRLRGRLEKFSALPIERRRTAERLVHLAAAADLANPPLISIAHRDQVDHNPIYHIHRLIRASDS